MGERRVTNVIDYFIGLDLGQAADYTAIAILEEPAWVPPTEPENPNDAIYWPRDRRGWVSISDLVPAAADHFRGLNYYHDQRPGRPPLFVRHLERVRHVSYSAIVQRVADLLQRPPLADYGTALLVDYGGPGRPVVDMLDQAGLHPRCIAIHGGQDVTVEGRVSRVPKRDLVVATQTALQDGRLRIASGLEHAATLTKELADYRVKISQTGHDSYDARSGQHDDLVLAVAMAVWFRDWHWKLFDQRAERSKQAERAVAYR